MTQVKKKSNRRALKRASTQDYPTVTGTLKSVKASSKQSQNRGFRRGNQSAQEGNKTQSRSEQRDAAGNVCAIQGRQAQPLKMVLRRNEWAKSSEFASSLWFFRMGPVDELERCRERLRHQLEPRPTSSPGEPVTPCMCSIGTISSRR